MVKYVTDHEAVRIQRFKGSVRFWGAIGLILLWGAGYTFLDRGAEASSLIVTYVALAAICLAIVAWQIQRFR